MGHSWGGRARTVGVAAIVLAGLALAGCEEQGSAEKAGQKIDQAVESLKQQTKDAVQEAEKKAAEAKEQLQESTRGVVEEAERKAGEAARAAEDAASKLRQEVQPETPPAPPKQP